MKKRLHSILLALALIGGGATVAAQQLNPLTKALFEAFEKTLAEDPSDFVTYYMRGAQYYTMSVYDKALADIESAIRYTPAKESEALTNEYSLLADIYQQTKEFDKALEAIDKALTITPRSYANIYKKGNILLELNRPEDAYTVFKQMLNLKSRSQEAFFGMALSSARMGNMSEATTLLEQAQEADSTSPLTYNRLGDLYREMKENATATVSYLSAITLGSDLTRPLNGLIDIAETDYPSFCAGADKAIKESHSSPTVNFILLAVYREIGDNPNALKCLNTLLESEGKDAKTLEENAYLLLHTGNTSDASAAIDASLLIEPTSDRRLLKAQIERVSGRPATSYLEAKKAYNESDDDIEALLEMARAAIANGDKDSALSALNEAILINADNPESLLLRAYVNTNMADNQTAAKGDLRRASVTEPKSWPGHTYKGIAMFKNGKKEEADSYIESTLAAHPSQQAKAGAAVYYGVTGRTEKAAALLEQAQQRGYNDVFVTTLDTTPWLSLSGAK